jgi:hypothetical protein
MRLTLSSPKLPLKLNNVHFLIKAASDAFTLAALQF